MGSLVVSPLLFLAIFMSFHGVHPHPDIEVLEIHILHAAHGTQFLGPYSRFGWNHPGPAYFYTLLPLYKLSEQRTVGLYLGAVLINLTATLAIMVFAYRTGDPYLSWWTTILLAVYMGYLYSAPGPIADPWNPYVTILPFGLVVFLCTALSIGRIEVLPLVVAAASFVVQTHIGYLPTTLAIIFISLLLYGSPCQRKAAGAEGVVPLPFTFSQPLNLRRGL
jgi:hypothetical protein